MEVGYNPFNHATPETMGRLFRAADVAVSLYGRRAKETTVCEFPAATTPHYSSPVNIATLREANEY